MPDGPAEDPPAGTPVVWWWEVTWRDGTRQTSQTEPRTDHRRAIIDAGAQLLRDLGATVTILED